MGADEEGTHERLQAHLGELVNPKIREHRGRIVKNTGDGFLAEFPSVVDAVRCAIEIQRGMADREPEVPEVPEERRIRFRIGVNLGDVIAESGDIYGDGVNVAARLEGLAEPAGICVSGMVWDHIRDKLPFSFEDKGEQSVKNIARPVRVYALRPETIAELPRADVPIALSRRRHSVVAPITAAIAAVLVIATFAWWFWPQTRSTSTTPAAVAATTSIAQPLVAPRLSIVVRPVVNLSIDPEQQYFADGINEDLTTDLSRIEDMFVISRNTAFTYRNKALDTKHIGHEVGVRYVLEGSLQRSRAQVRINAQLVDVETGGHLWAERFDSGIGDLFALQNEITGRIANTLNVELITAEVVRSGEGPDAMDYMLRGRAAYWKPPSRESYAKAVGLFEHALTLDPQSPEAAAWLATVLVGQGLLNGGSSTADIERAEALIGQALARAPGNMQAHFAKGQLLRLRLRPAEAIPEFETVIASNRNWAMAYYALGQCKGLAGAIEEVVPLTERAIRLSPRDPFIGVWYWEIGAVHLLQSRTDEAIVWFEKARSANSQLPAPHFWLASAYALKGETERAASELAEAQSLSDGRYSSIARLTAVGYWGVPKIRALFETTYFVGLRKAGLPEE
jgi:TolB-like protein